MKYKSKRQANNHKLQLPWHNLQADQLFRFRSTSRNPYMRPLAAQPGPRLHTDQPITDLQMNQSNCYNATNRPIRLTTAKVNENVFRSKRG